MRMSSRRKQTYTPLANIGANDHEEKPSHRVPSPFILLLLVFYLVLLFITKAIEDDLPSVVQEKYVSKDNSDTFSEETARKYLHRIIGDQPRVAGTEYHLQKTKDIKDLVDEIASKANLPVKTDWQFASGDYWLAFNSPHVNIYQNISNVIAVLEGDSGFPNGTIGTSLLVNCHYDSVPFAIGASDNGVFCSAMAEILSKLSRRKKKLKHNVIFLFNGAEETALMASHGFLQHPWSKGVMNVINLDSAGMNGKPSLFQVTDPRILEIYKKSQRPNAQGIGEFLFASGIIPSDTDFRIFRDFGHINGVDIAFIRGGNVYHTRNDRAEFIQDGVIQNAGEMLLGLVKELANSDVLDTKEPKSTFVYYDYMGLFMVAYSINIALIVDVSVGLLGLASVWYFLWMFGLRKSAVVGLLWSSVGRGVSVILGLVMVMALTFIMIVTTSQMRYLSAHWMVLPLYVLPHLITELYTVYLYDDWLSKKTNLSRSIRGTQAMSATRLLLSTFLLVLCCLPSLANVRYVITVPLLLMSVTSFVSTTVVRYVKPKAWQHLILELLLATPATMFGLGLSIRLVPFLAPLMGRSAADHPDYIIAAASVGLFIITFCALSGIELLFSRRRMWLVLSCMFVLSAVFMAIPLTPYSGLTTQRHYWFHTQITTYDENQKPKESVSGVLITRPDLYSVEYALKAIKDSPYYEKDSRGKDSRGKDSLIITDSDLTIISPEKCAKSLYCDMPMYRTRFERYNINSLFVKMSPPEHFEHSLKLVNKTCAEDNCVMYFVAQSPGYDSITISPRSPVTLSSWSLSSPLQETIWFDSRPVYVFVRAIGTYSEVMDPMEFSLTFNKPRNYSGPLTDMTHHAHRVYSPPHFTPHYQRLLSAMPDYFNIATYLSFRNNYVF